MAQLVYIYISLLKNLLIKESTRFAFLETNFCQMKFIQFHSDYLLQTFNHCLLPSYIHLTPVRNFINCVTTV